MSNDPRRLVLVLQELGRALRTWTVTGAGLDDEVRRSAWQGADSAAILHEDALQLSGRNDAAQVEVLRVAQEASAAHAAAEHSALEAAQARSSATAMQEASAAAVSMWQGSLQRAIARLQAARAERDRAQAFFAQAQSNLHAAESALASAQSALSRCQSSWTTDAQGNRRAPDCSGYAAAVSRAHANVNSAQRQRDQAMAALQQAEDEVGRAERVETECRNGVNRAEGLARQSALAASDAMLATGIAQDAMLSGVQALDAAGVAEEAARMAQGQVAETLAQSAQVSDAVALARQAAAAYAALMQQQVEHGTVSEAELREAEDQLHRFDSPTGLA